MNCERLQTHIRPSDHGRSDRRGLGAAGAPGPDMAELNVRQWGPCLLFPPPHPHPHLGAQGSGSGSPASAQPWFCGTRPG